MPESFATELGRSELGAPIVVGGVGGSGTRLIAEMLLELGFYMGRAQNGAHDNLWFTLLLKRPRWFHQQGGRSRTKIEQALDLFGRLMRGQRPGLRDSAVIARAVLDNCIMTRSAGRGMRMAASFLKMFHPMKPAPSSFTGWGWKEPNSHVYLRDLAAHFPSMKYIHVIRHGLDMAFSKNQSQLHNWGSLYGIGPADNGSYGPRSSLQYWINANRTAIDCGRAIFGHRFLLIHFDDFCALPEKGVETLLDFLEVSCEDQKRARLASLPRVPRSTGRYRNHDLSVFNDAELQAVRELGFNIAREARIE